MRDVVTPSSNVVTPSDKAITKHQTAHASYNPNMYMDSRTGATHTGDIARAAELVYSAPEKREQRLKELGIIQHYGIDPRFNDEDFLALHHRQSNKTYLVHRGTSLDRSPIRDLLSDAEIVNDSFQHSSRYHNSVYKTRRAMKILGERDMELVGHSLGGTTAHYVGNEVGLTSHAFNPGHSWANKWSAPVNKGGTHHVYATKGDWISQAVPVYEKQAAQIHTNEDKVGRPHSIENWY